MQKAKRSTWVKTGIAAIVVVVIAAGAIYWKMEGSSVEVADSLIQAPIIDLAPTVSGKLEQLFVNEGDIVPANTPVAQVGNEVIKTKVAGLITSVPDKIGSLVNPGQEVVEMIDPTELRVVGKIDENKGLSQIAVGDRVAFTVDAFGGKQFAGVVDEISPTAVQSGIVFDISNERPTQQFDVEVRFDTAANPEIKNGMSARMWIYPKQ